MISYLCHGVPKAEAKDVSAKRIFKKRIPKTFQIWWKITGSRNATNSNEDKFKNSAQRHQKITKNHGQRKSLESSQTGGEVEMPILNVRTNSPKDRKFPIRKGGSQKTSLRCQKKRPINLKVCF